MTNFFKKKMKQTTNCLLLMLMLFSTIVLESEEHQMVWKKNRNHIFFKPPLQIMKPSFMICFKKFMFSDRTHMPHVWRNSGLPTLQTRKLGKGNHDFLESKFFFKKSFFHFSYFSKNWIKCILILFTEFQDCVFTRWQQDNGQNNSTSSKQGCWWKSNWRNEIETKQIVSLKRIGLWKNHFTLCSLVGI